MHTVWVHLPSGPRYMGLPSSSDGVQVCFFIFIFYKYSVYTILYSIYILLAAGFAGYAGAYPAYPVAPPLKGLVGRVQVSNAFACERGGSLRQSTPARRRSGHYCAVEVKRATELAS